MLVAGGKGVVRPGRHLFLKTAGGEVPVANLYLMLAEWMGVHLSSFGTWKGQPYGTSPLVLT